MRAFLNADGHTPALEFSALLALLTFVAALQISIAVAETLGVVTLGCWVAWLSTTRRRPTAPTFFGALLVYAALTLVSVVFSRDPRISLVDAKELLLFLVVPVVFQLARGQRAQTLATVIVTVGGISAVYGVVQFGILDYYNLGQRPSGSMGHYMTYSGLLVLVISLACARALFDARERTWSFLVMPALAAALMVTRTRSNMIGAGVAVGLLFVMRDFRLLSVVPVLAALFLVLAPPQITARIYSTFDMQDPTVRDRFAMARAGVRIVRDHPVTGIGRDMVKEVYPDYRETGAVQDETPHLHNVPLQIAAERGLAALAAWLVFLALVLWDLVRLFRDDRTRGLAAAGLAAMAGMLTAGMFEYNFGDSEFLMLFLVIITLPLAAAQRVGHAPVNSNPSDSGTT